MIKQLLNTLILISASSAPAQIAAKSDSIDSLPIAARQALTRWNFKFKLFAESNFTPEVNELFKEDKVDLPMKVEGDFNGDKVTDYALLGEADKQQYAVAVVSNKKNYSVIVIKSWSDEKFKQSSVPGDDGKRIGVPVYLATSPSTEFDKTKNDKPKVDLIHVEAYQGAIDAFKIEGAKAMNLKERKG